MWGLMAALLVVLWVRSDWVSDEIEGMVGTHNITCGSQKGRLRITTEDCAGFLTDVGEAARGPWQYSTHAVYPGLRQYMSGSGRTDNGGVHINAPHCLVVFVAGAFASLPLLRRRFSLRTLLIATTLVALLFGLGLYASR
jgi:hypothetical protein